MTTFEIAMCAAVNACSAAVCSASAALTCFGELLGARQQRRPLVGSILAGRPDQLARRLLLGAQIVGGRDGGAPRGVGVQQRVDERGVLPPRALRRAHPVGVFAQQLEVDHDRNPTFGRRPRP